MYLLKLLDSSDVSVNPCLAYPVCLVLLELRVLHVLNEVMLVVSGVNAQLNHLPLQHVAMALQHHLSKATPLLPLSVIPQAPLLAVKGILKLVHLVV